VYSTDITYTEDLQTYIIGGFEVDQQNPAISGTTVVWEDNFFGDMDIFMADLQEPARPIESVVSSIAATQSNPDIDGHIIVFQDNRYGDWDIVAYNITTKQEFFVTTNSADQTNPAISGNLVVFQDNSTGTWNIHAAILDDPVAAECLSIPPGDTNNDCKVDMTDLAAIAASWLQCGLEPQTACWQ